MADHSPMLQVHRRGEKHAPWVTRDELVAARDDDYDRQVLRGLKPGERFRFEWGTVRSPRVLLIVDPELLSRVRVLRMEGASPALRRALGEALVLRTPWPEPGLWEGTWVGTAPTENEPLVGLVFRQRGVGYLLDALEQEELRVLTPCLVNGSSKWAEIGTCFRTQRSLHIHLQALPCSGTLVVRPRGALAR